VTNITFNFAITPNTKPKEKKWHIKSPPSEKVGEDTSPVFPTKSRPWA